MKKLVTFIAAYLWICPVYAFEGNARVIDGDTIVVAGQRVRLQNFNAPELSEPAGIVAKHRLEAIIAASVVSCIPKARDRYARIVARCSVNGRDLGEAMRQAQ